jgi:WS/DGAT/MGAT family acyltransferase
MHRPLWECHFVDGLERNRFAVYVKVHHGVVDGSSAIRLLLMAMSTDPDTRGMGPFWALAAETEPSSRSALPNPIVAVRRLLSASAQTVGHVVDGSLTLPYVTPNSILRQTLTASRDFAVVDLELAKVKAVAKAAECTLNDLVVYVCATAVRRFLDDRESLPDRPLTAAIPVNLRAEHDNSVGNTIAQIYVSLATNVADPLDRLHTIKRSIDAAKTQMKALPGATSMLYTLLADAPYGLAMLAGLGGRSPVPYSMSISNIPGPKDPVYVNGARMETFYAPAFLMHGGSLIVICTSYVDKLTLTITAANEQLDEVDQMIALLRDAFDEISGLVTNPGAPS